MGDILSARITSNWIEPLEMLDACHSKLQLQLQAIRQVVDRVSREGADDTARKSAMAVLRYFSTAAYNHHEDEERDLFPAVLGAVPRTERRQTKALIDRLLDDHRRMADVRELVLSRLFAVTQGKAPGFEDGAIENFASIYLEHMRLENEQLMPLARRVLSETQIRSLAVTMSVRRGAKLEDLASACSAR